MSYATATANVFRLFLPVVVVDVAIVVVGVRRENSRVNLNFKI